MTSTKKLRSMIQQCGITQTIHGQTIALILIQHWECLQYIKTDMLEKQDMYLDFNHMLIQHII
jgi:hypothetical protein